MKVLINAEELELSNSASCPDQGGCDDYDCPDAGCADY